MRPGQNKRMRGRNNNNNGGRKGPNPLTRSYESNGPDVKIRGTAQHIGEKYLQLARDAQTSGDPVAAESYLQHAEHYFRLIAAAQQAQFQAQNGFARPGTEAEADESDDDDDLGGIPDRFALPSERIQPPPPPPYAPPAQPYGERQNGQPYPERQERQDRPEGQDRPYRQDRFNNNADRDGGQRGPQDRGGQPNFDRGPQQQPATATTIAMRGTTGRIAATATATVTAIASTGTAPSFAKTVTRNIVSSPACRSRAIRRRSGLSPLHRRRSKRAPSLPAFITAPVRSVPHRRPNRSEAPLRPEHGRSRTRGSGRPVRAFVPAGAAVRASLRPARSKARSRRQARRKPKTSARGLTGYARHHCGRWPSMRALSSTAGDDRALDRAARRALYSRLAQPSSGLSRRGEP